MVQIALPPPARAPRPVFARLPAGTVLCRLFNPSSHGATATGFRRFGPLLRFDHHQAVQGKPAADPGRGVYYAALSLSCCVVEVFGDTGLIECGEWQVAMPRLTREVRLLDLRGRGAMRAGSVAALAKVPDPPLSQAWSRWFYERPEYQQPEGLLWSNAHNDEGALALYEGAENALECPEDHTIPLGEPVLRPLLLQIAEANHLVCVP